MKPKVLLTSGVGPMNWAVAANADVIIALIGNNLSYVNNDKVVIYPQEARMAEILSVLPWKPDFILHFNPEYLPFPKGLDDVDIPTVCTIADWQYYFHLGRIASRYFDIVLPIGGGVTSEEMFKRAQLVGSSRMVHAVNYHGADPHLYYDLKMPRTIDFAYSGCYKTPILYRYRYRMIENCRKTRGLKCFPPVPPFAEYNKFLNTCKVVFHRNITMFPWFGYGHSSDAQAPRYFDARAAGCEVEAFDETFKGLDQQPISNLTRDKVFAQIFDYLACVLPYVNKQQMPDEKEVVDRLYLDMFCSQSLLLQGPQGVMNRINTLPAKYKDHFKWLFVMRFGGETHTGVKAKLLLKHLKSYADRTSLEFEYPFLPAKEYGLDESRLRVLHIWHQAEYPVDRASINRVNYAKWLEAQPDCFERMTDAWAEDYHAWMMQGNLQSAREQYPWITDFKDGKYIIKVGQMTC